MITLNKKLWNFIQRYADAQEADSWKGGGNPTWIPEIERELQVSRVNLKILIQELIPEGGSQLNAIH